MVSSAVLPAQNRLAESPFSGWRALSALGMLTTAAYHIPYCSMHARWQRETCAGRRRKGKEYQQRFAYGKPVTDMSVKALSTKKRRTGTEVEFMYDRGIFSKR